MEQQSSQEKNMEVKNMNKIHFITGNDSKFAEAKILLEGTGIELIKTDIKMPEIKSSDEIKVLLKKAEDAFNAIGAPIIVDDTGIYFEAYHKFPGTYTKYLYEAVGIHGIKQLLNIENKNAYFKTMVCYKDSHQVLIFEGIMKGKMNIAEQGTFNENWSYNQIFFPEGFSKSLAEFTLDERARVSHRKKAFEGLQKFLQEKTLKETIKETTKEQIQMEVQQ
jgi:XTP/dITP diphosphohydrolase